MSLEKRDKTALELHREGNTYRDIMAKMDLTYGQVLHGIRRAREAENGLRSAARRYDSRSAAVQSVDELLQAFGRGRKSFTIGELADRLDRGLGLSAKL